MSGYAGLDGWTGVGKNPDDSFRVGALQDYQHPLCEHILASAKGTSSTTSPSIRRVNPQSQRIRKWHSFARRLLPRSPYTKICLKGSTSFTVR
jgi:hypothetical protein